MLCSDGFERQDYKVYIKTRLDISRMQINDEMQQLSSFTRCLHILIYSCTSLTTALITSDSVKVKILWCKLKRKYNLLSRNLA